MIRPRRARAISGILTTVLLVSGLALVDAAGGPIFNPNQFIGTNSSFYSYSANMNFDTSLQDRSAMVKSYRVDMPAGWHVAIGSVDPSTAAGCTNLNAANIEASAERIGYTQLTLHNDDTRGRSGPIPFSGFLYLLNFDAVTETATLCSRMSTLSSLIPFGNREVMFQITLKYNTVTGGVLSWNYATVPGETPAGSRAIFDSPYYSSKNTTVLYTRLELNTLSAGNYHTDTAGKKSGVRFLWNPDTPGDYNFVGTYTPCGPGDAGLCDPTGAPAVRSTIVRITNYPVGYHPGPVLTAPTLWSVNLGTAPTDLKWLQPVRTAPGDRIKGYVIRISADYQADSMKTIYLVTDATSPSVASPNPCGTDGAASECVYPLALPYQSDTGKTISSNANYSMTMITLFADGHRSDGRCDDGSGLGSSPPCPDGVVPAYSAAGTVRTQFMHRDKSWPLIYRQIAAASKAAYGTYQVYVLLADLEAHEFEFVEWKPVGAAYSGRGPSIVGSNAGAGAISFHQLSGATRYHIELALTPTSAVGYWLRTSSTNGVQHGTTWPDQRFGLLSKI